MSAPAAGKVVLVCPEGLAWVQDATQTIVVDAQHGQAHILRGLEMAVWDWLTLAYPYGKLVRLTAALLCIPPAEAEAKLAELFQQWQAAGLLAAGEQGDG